jgi:tRNA modification GTPase
MSSSLSQTEDTICALSTPAGVGAIAVLRVSGKDTFPILNRIFKARGDVDLMPKWNHTK